MAARKAPKRSSSARGERADRSTGTTGISAGKRAARRPRPSSPPTAKGSTKGSTKGSSKRRRTRDTSVKEPTARHAEVASAVAAPPAPPRPPAVLPTPRATFVF